MKIFLDLLLHISTLSQHGATRSTSTSWQRTVWPTECHSFSTSGLKKGEGGQEKGKKRKGRNLHECVEWKKEKHKFEVNK